MKKAMIVYLSILSAGVAAGIVYADTNDRGSRTEPGNTIILPDVQLTIQDDSSVPLLERTNATLDDDIVSIGSVSLEDLAASEVNERIRSQFVEEQRRGNFSLSSFKLSYGRYEDMQIDINLGKSIESLNYLINYTRNKRKSIGFDTNNYYNTELELDDLKLDFLYAAGEKLDLNLSLGYFDRSLNLFTNSLVQTEFKMHVPLGFETTYYLNMNSRLIGNVGYDYLQLDHKLSAGNYEREGFGEFHFKGAYEGDYSRDNSFKASLEYRYGSYAGNNLHEGSIRVLDKFPIVESLAMEAGAGVFLYNYAPVFWYPKAFLYYKYSNVFSFELGIEGIEKNFDIDEMLKSDQIYWTNSSPNEYWNYKAAMSVSPSKYFTVRLEAAYEDYFSYLDYRYDASRELYAPVDVTNVGILHAKAGFEMLVKESFSVHADYEYEYSTVTNLLFFSPHTASLSVEYKSADAGFRISTVVAYKHFRFLTGSLQASPYVDWSAQVSKSLTKDILIELDADNILNEKILDRLDVPESGFSYHAGVKILL